MSVQELTDKRVKGALTSDQANEAAQRERLRQLRQQEAKEQSGSLKPTCGDCAGFRNLCLIPGKKIPCVKQGIGEYAKPCKRYSPDTSFLDGETKITKDGDHEEEHHTAFRHETISDLASLIGGMADNALVALGKLMVNEKRTRAQGFRFMQKVYVRYRGYTNRNYVSNFLEAYVLYATGKQFKLISRDGRCVLTYAENCRPVIYTEEEFEPVYEQMMRKGALLDPDTVSLITARWRSIEEHELGLAGMVEKVAVSTIDDVFTANNVRKESKKGLPDLISLVASVAAGYEGVDKEAKVYSRDVKRDVETKTPRRSSAVRVRTVRNDDGSAE